MPTNRFEGAGMSYDHGLAQRVREIIGQRPGVSERAMFGGLAFLVDGKMFVGISGSSLLARVGAERYDDALALPHVRQMDFTGRPMRGYVYVDPAGLANDRDVQAWVTWCVEYVARLPAKKSRASPHAARPPGSTGRRRW
jgi:TfoX/Sxy family transcriptional regulator of competence genes